MSPSQIFLIMLAAAASMLARANSFPENLEFIPDEVVSSGVSEPVFKTAFVTTEDCPQSVHSGTLTHLPNGKLMAAWFGGSREGAKDVCIYSSVAEPSGEWSAPRIIASREETMADLNRYVRKLGNPVLGTDGNGRVWLYYVTVSVGGWSGSSITSRYSDDCGETWSKSRRLIVSPFLNISTLVKEKPLLSRSGHLLLPVYHEIFNKYAELLVLDEDGGVSDKYRLNADGRVLQPSIIAKSKAEAHVFCRQAGHADQLARMNNFDLSSAVWTKPQSTSIRNPNSALSAVRRWNGQLMMVCNTGDRRERLTIAISDDGSNWTEARRIEAGGEGDEFSYPYLIRGLEPGTYHLIYTWQREKMKVVTFNDASLERAL